MPQFMLLLNENSANLAKLSPEEMQKAMGRYMAWSKKPFCLEGKRLAPDKGRVMQGEMGAKPRVTDGPHSESKEVLGGLYIIEAASYDEAVAHTMDHPHLEYGGVLTVRQLA